MIVVRIESGACDRATNLVLAQHRVRAEMMRLNARNRNATQIGCILDFDVFER